MSRDDQIEQGFRQRERSAHAVYGLVILSSTLVADLAGAAGAGEALLVLWGGMLVLLITHLYAALVAEVGQKGRLLSHAERHILVADNIPLLVSLLVPTALISLAGVGVLSLRLAIELSLVVSIGGLFVLGAYQAGTGGASRSRQVMVGAVGISAGVVVILLEVVLAH